MVHKRWVETNVQTDKALVFLNTQDTAIQTLIHDLRDWIDKLYEYDGGLYDGKLAATITREDLLKTILAIPVINRDDGLMLASEDIKRIILDANPKLKAVFGQSMYGFLGLCRQLLALRDITISNQQQNDKSAEKKNFTNGTNIDDMKSQEEIDKQLNASGLAAALSKRVNKEKRKQLYQLVKDKFGVTADNNLQLMKVLNEKGIDMSSDDLDTVIEIIENCRT